MCTQVTETPIQQYTGVAREATVTAKLVDNKASTERVGLVREGGSACCTGGAEAKRKKAEEGRFGGEGSPSLRTVWRRPLDRTPETGSGGQVGNSMSKRVGTPCAVRQKKK